MGLIPAVGYDRHWFNGGVVVGGLGVAWALTESVPVGIAVIGGLASAAAMIFTFDREGEWRWSRAVPAIVILTLGARALKVPVFRGVVGFIFFIIIGYIAVGVGKIIRKLIGVRS